jgi:uncharacterized protein YndB with AHSA1/START domain
MIPFLLSSKAKIQQLESGNDKIIFVVDFVGKKPVDLFDYWTSPELLMKWWPPVAELEPRIGGHYHLSWPKQDWHLRGTYTVFQRGNMLQFTWKWDHEHVDLTKVTVSLEDLRNNGTRLTLRHEGYPEDDTGSRLRSEHIEGWKYLLGKLQHLTMTSA